ncbi:FAD-binding domain-containing protein [Paracoccus sp. NSM]|uniref:FAD-binding domain-containing protein n=1 Tax=Paracoccus sp. NSM TaxID=3457784 RepID=UPI0040358528
MSQPLPTRAEALARLDAFTPRMGRHYAARRNHDLGPGRHQGVSGLSPWIRHRLLTEQEVVARAVQTHAGGAEKFVQEVVWRSYFKGWLEQRPAIWAAYRSGLAVDLAAAARDPALAARIDAAEAGRTGIACMDAWANELRETGYLHNHARMWFASIWIFTLGLPWRVGADFFLRHLIDGCPSSNTLGWRWVAGLHTRGKAYEATAENIARFTEGRHNPDPSQLAQGITPLDHTEPEGLPRPHLAPPGPAPDPRLPALLLITAEDGCPEDFGLSAHDIRGAVTLASGHLRSPRAVADHVLAFEAGALADAAARAGIPAQAIRADAPDALIGAAQSCGARQIVTPHLPQGPLRDWLDCAAPALEGAGLSLRHWSRDWDRAFWPQATAGFFKVKERISRTLAGLGITARD